MKNNFLKKLSEILAAWLFSPKSTHTRSCRDIAEDKQEEDKRGQHK
jgi:hypothetical protein